MTAFGLTTLVLTTALGRWLGEPRSAPLEDAWRDFARRADEYDVVFLGTSRVRRHIDPQVVEDALRERGVGAKPYNLGLPKMSVLEGAELIERIERRRPRRLKLVVLEPTLYLYDADNWTTDRDMAAHDWRGAWLAVRLTWGSEARRGTSLWGKLRCVSPHLLSFFCRSLNLRRGEGMFSNSSTDAPGPPPSESAGFAPLPADDKSLAPEGETPAWRLRFERFLEIEPNWSGPGLSRDELSYFDDLNQRIRRSGARPVFLLGPKVKRDSHTAAVLRAHRERYAAVPLLDYLHGRGPREIYDVRYWHDFDHLNAEGAARFSRMLAADLAPLLAQ